jgi:phage tail sheath gpL-like
MITNYQDAEDFFGAGSFGAYLAARALRQEGASRVPIYGVGMAEASGGAKAKGEVTFTGPATSSGTCTIMFGGATISFAIASGDAATDIGPKFKTAFDALRSEIKPPFTSSMGATDDLVDFEANNKGLSAGDGSVTDKGGFGWRLVSCTAAGVGVSFDDERLGGDVAGSGIPDPTNALASIAGTRTHYLVPSVTDDTGDATGSLKVYMAHVRTKSDSPEMLGSILCGGCKLSPSDQITNHDALETEGDVSRLLYFGCEDPTAWEPAIAVAAAVARAANEDVSVPNNGEVLTEVDAPEVADKPTYTERETALEGGVSMVYSPDGSSVQVVRYVSAATDKGASPCLDITAVETMDEIRERVVAAWAAAFQNVKIKEEGQKVYTSKCTTPSGVKEVCIGVLKDMEVEDKVQGVDTIKDMISVTQDVSEVTVEVPSTVVPQLASIDATFRMFLSIP